MIDAAELTSDEERRDALVRKLSADAIGALDLLCVYIGDRLGLYRALAGRLALTPAELAAASGVHERYAREWLEQQTVSGILDAENPAAPADERRYRLPPGHDEVLVDDSSLDFGASLAQGVVACTPALDAVLEAFRTGGGVAYAAYGADAHESQARGTRALYEKLLTSRWLPAVPALDARLQGIRPPGSPTSPAVTAIRPSRSRAGIPRCWWMGSISTSPQSARRESCCRQADLRTGLASITAMQQTLT